MNKQLILDAIIQKFNGEGSFNQKGLSIRINKGRLTAALDGECKQYSLLEMFDFKPGLHFETGNVDLDEYLNSQTSWRAYTSSIVMNNEVLDHCSDGWETIFPVGSSLPFHDWKVQLLPSSVATAPGVLVLLPDSVWAHKIFERGTASKIKNLTGDSEFSKKYIDASNGIRFRLENRVILLAYQLSFTNSSLSLQGTDTKGYLSALGLADDGFMSNARKLASIAIAEKIKENK